MLPRYAAALCPSPRPAIRPSEIEAIQATAHQVISLEHRIGSLQDQLAALGAGAVQIVQPLILYAALPVVTLLLDGAFALLILGDVLPAWLALLVAVASAGCAVLLEMLACHARQRALGFGRRLVYGVFGFVPVIAIAAVTVCMIVAIQINVGGAESLGVSVKFLSLGVTAIVFHLLLLFAAADAEQAWRRIWSKVKIARVRAALRRLAEEYEHAVVRFEMLYMRLQEQVAAARRDNGQREIHVPELNEESRSLLAQIVVPKQSLRLPLAQITANSGGSIQ